MLGDVEETIYAVDDEDDDEETKVSELPEHDLKRMSLTFSKDDKQEIRDVICTR